MNTVAARLAAALADRYTIQRELGQGGMATVYLAHDLKHDRKVALKVLKPELAAVIGAERFVVEIRTTASLQHPHILPLFDSGTADSFLYYVMPFIDGETLRAKLDRETQIGIEESVKITTAVADALDYAHRRGVVHRDIKPENILLHDGRPMVADFGIALALSAAAGGRMTETGMSLGTPHYMSPEQATAEKEITARSDVYSLGSVLYEMLTGNPPHTGASAQQIIMKIVTEEAAPVTRLRKAVPPNVAAAVAKSLEKLPADRFESAKAFGEALADRGFTTAAIGGGAAAGESTSWRARAAMPLAAAAVLLMAIAAWGWLRPVPGSVAHVVVAPLAGTTFLPAPGWPALSPDGGMVVFAAASDGVSRLYRRPVDGFAVEVIEGSEDATYPFFSPAGDEVGFFTGSRQLKKVPLAGGRSTALADIPFWRSWATWRRDGTILVISDARGLYVVPDHGGILEPFATTQMGDRDTWIDKPLELSDGTLVAILSNGSAGAPGRIVTLAPGDTMWQPTPGPVGGTYIPPGFLLSKPGDEVVASRYDLASGKSSGLPAAVLPGLRLIRFLYLNARGDAAYFASPDAPPMFLVEVSRSGVARRLPVPPGYFRHPRISPDGRSLALNLANDLWILDLSTNRWTRLTTDASITEPQWSPDGKRLLHTVYDSATGFNLPVWRDRDGDGTEHPLGASIGGDAWNSDWSTDGRHIALYGGPVGQNVYVADLERPDSVVQVSRVSGTARNARFSPDGRWLAYQSNETGRMQVYVVAFPGLTGRTPVSTEGGTEPAWKPGGGEIYYRNGSGMMAVSIATAPALRVGPPRELFRKPYLEDLYGDRSFDVMPDGEHFLMFESNPAGVPQLRVIRNWVRELEATLKDR